MLTVLQLRQLWHDGVCVRVPVERSGRISIQRHRVFMLRRLLLFTVTMLSLSVGHAGAPVEHTIEEQTGLESWVWEGKDNAITFNQRLPDQSRAYFQGRGFRPGDAELIGRDRVFQAIIHNRSEASAPMRLDLAEWLVETADARPRPMRLEADWQRVWERREVSQPARIAFRWSLFPTRQIFEPGDWNMGMVTMKLAPESRFDLEVIWHQGEELRRVRFEGMRCAPDRHI